MKLNKRVLASAAISASLVATAVTPVAWATGEHLNFAQNFRAGVDFDAGINANVAEHLQRNCKLSVGQITELSVSEMAQTARELLGKDNTPLYSEEELKRLSHSEVVREARINGISSDDDGKGPAEGGQQSEAPLMVNDVKAGDREITGSVFCSQVKRRQFKLLSQTSGH